MRGPAVVRREHGSASVLVVGAVGAVVMVLSAVLVLVGAVRDVHRVQAAADLAALAAAGETSGGYRPNCRAARSVAEANGVRLTRCTLEPDGSVVVRTAVHRRWLREWRLPTTISARARAGVVDVAGTSTGGTPVPGPADRQLPGLADRLDAPPARSPVRR